MSDKAAVIAILSDLGTQEHYVGAMKGVITRIAPQAKILDLTHAVTHCDIAEGAQLLVQASTDYPSGTIFLAAVNPSASETGRGLAARAKDGCWFVGLDNGLLTSALHAHGIDVIYSLENEELRYHSKSPLKFLGRDIYAPAAAHLANGADPTLFGPVITDPVPLAPPECKREGDALVGIVQRVDYFGNIITSIPEAELQTIGAVAGKGSLHVDVDGTDLVWPYSSSYAHAEDRGGLTLLDAAGFLQLSLNKGSFCEAHGGKKGDTVKVSWRAD